MASGPWFFFQDATFRPGFTKLRLTPPFPTPPNPPISSQSWVLASVTEMLNGEPHQGDAALSVANVAPQDDRSILITVASTWGSDLQSQIKLVFWTGV
jgi:hypothetical protein